VTHRFEPFWRLLNNILILVIILWILSMAIAVPTLWILIALDDDNPAKHRLLEWTVSAALWCFAVTFITVVVWSFSLHRPIKDDEKDNSAQ